MGELSITAAVALLRAEGYTVRPFQIRDAIKSRTVKLTPGGRLFKPALVEWAHWNLPWPVAVSIRACEPLTLPKPITRHGQRHPLPVWRLLE